MLRYFAFSAILALPVSLLAQPDPSHPEHENLTTPSGWLVRTDRPFEDLVVGPDREESHIYFVNMTPGWHITTGPAAILYHPDLVASGSYRLETKIHLFDPGERREAFGMFFGASNLENDDLAYDYFLLRNSGEFLIKSRTGASTSVIRDWTATEHMVTFESESEGSVENVLVIEIGADMVTFFVNGNEVASHERSALRTDGIAGLRINHALNVHVESITVQ